MARKVKKAITYKEREKQLLLKRLGKVTTLRGALGVFLDAEEAGVEDVAAMAWAQALDRAESVKKIRKLCYRLEQELLWELGCSFDLRHYLLPAFQKAAEIERNLTKKPQRDTMLEL